MFSSLPSGTALFSESALHEAETLLSLGSTSNGGSGEELRDRVLNAECPAPLTKPPPGVKLPSRHRSLDRKLVSHF